MYSQLMFVNTQLCKSQTENFADLLVLLLQFRKTPLDIAVDIGRHDLFELMQLLSVCSTSHTSSIKIHSSEQLYGTALCVFVCDE